MHHIQKMVIIPALTGVFLCVVSFFAVKSTDSFLPIKQGTVFAYHHIQPEKADDVKNVGENSVVGSISFASKQFDLVFENEYANMENAVSMLKTGSTPDAYGCVYLKTVCSNAKAVEGAKTLRLNTVYGDFEYKFKEKMTADSEYKALSYVPRAKKSAVLFYQKSNGIGLSGEYEVFVFEETD